MRRATLALIGRLFGTRKRHVGVAGGAVAVATDTPRSAARHEAVIARLGLALAKERRGRARPDRIAGFEAELRRHRALLARLRSGQSS